VAYLEASYVHLALAWGTFSTLAFRLIIVFGFFSKYVVVDYVFLLDDFHWIAVILGNFEDILIALVNM